MTDADHLAAILASPEDDAPRLIYADWLDEQGESDRAEFIRVQCALAIPHDPVKPSEVIRFARLLARDLKLWHRLPTAKVFAPFASGISTNPGFSSFWIGDQSGPLCEVRRGYVDAVSCQAADWLEHGPAIVSQHPVEEVRLAKIYDRERQVFAPFATGLHSNDIDHCPVCNVAALRWARHEAVQRGLVPEGVARAWGVEVTNAPQP